MMVSYQITARSQDGHPIAGHAMIRSVPEEGQLGGLIYRVESFAMTCDGKHLCGCGEKCGSIQFMNGPTSDVVLTGGATWILGEWTNDATGAWFGHADGSRYPGPSATFGNKAAYEILAPRIELDASNMLAPSPFLPEGRLGLTMLPDGITSLAAASGTGPIV